MLIFFVNLRVRFYSLLMGMTAISYSQCQLHYFIPATIVHCKNILYWCTVRGSLFSVYRKIYYFSVLLTVKRDPKIICEWFFTFLIFVTYITGDKKLSDILFSALTFKVELCCQLHRETMTSDLQKMACRIYFHRASTTRHQGGMLLRWVV